MDQKSSDKMGTQKPTCYAGAGLVIGAGMGMIFGLLLFEDLSWGSGMGAGLGLVFGATVDARGKRQTKSSDNGEE